MHGLIISNTTVKRNVKSKYKEETGGLSGEPLFEESTKVLIMARKILNDFGFVFQLLPLEVFMMENQHTLKFYVELT